MKILRDNIFRGKVHLRIPPQLLRGGYRVLAVRRVHGALWRGNFRLLRRARWRNGFVRPLSIRAYGVRQARRRL